MPKFRMVKPENVDEYPFWPPEMDAMDGVIIELWDNEIIKAEANNGLFRYNVV